MAEAKKRKSRAVTKQKKATTDAQYAEFQKLRAVLDGIDEVIYVADPETYELLYVNEAFKAIFGDGVGGRCYDVLQGFDGPCSFCTNDRIFGENEGTAYVWEFQNTKTEAWFRCIDKAIAWPDGRTVRYEMAVDISRQKEAEAIVRRQQEEMLELSTPVIEVWEGIIVAPLIGSLDSQRTERFMQRYLDAIVKHNASIALVDITGVPTVDTQTAQHLIETITASRLLGTTAILTGVRPTIAQTLVHLGVDLSEMLTCASLRAGLNLALARVNLKVTAD